jgi:uncharacterized protein YqgV (UPF0045/DUF77 family)
MSISSIINFLKENYVSNADEVYECLSLLNDTLDTVLAAIQHSSAEAFEQRDFSKIKSYAETADEINKVQDKIKGYMEQLRVNIPDEAVNDDEVEPAYEEEPVKQRDQDEFKVDSSIKHSLNEDFTFKKPAAFEIESTRIEVRDWRELFLITCEILVRRDRLTFESFISDPSMNGRRLKYFAKLRRGMTSPKKLPGTDIYISMQLGSNGMKVLISKMLRKYNIDPNKYYVYFSEDYSSLLKK